MVVHIQVTIESHLENDEFKKKVQDISQENEDIKERLSKLEGLEKMIAFFCPAILSGVSTTKFKLVAFVIRRFY
ncbi:hypothetical protein Bca101_048548 [Brassica carinata]